MQQAGTWSGNVFGRLNIPTETQLCLAAEGLEGTAYVSGTHASSHPPPGPGPDDSQVQLASVDTLPCSSNEPAGPAPMVRETLEDRGMVSVENIDDLREQLPEGIGPQHVARNRRMPLPTCFGARRHP